MTGFGNSAMEVLRNHGSIDLVAIFTSKRQEGPFPYYPCDHLYEAASKEGIPVYEGPSLKERATVELIRSLYPGLAVVSTFNQIIPEEIIQLPEHGIINLHPSLLPQYRGTTPTVWVLLNGEEQTGVTAHFIEDETIDNGRIIVQSVLKILPQDTEGTLRFRLAELSKTTLVKAIDLVLTTGKSASVFPDMAKASYFPKRTIEDSEIDVNKPLREIINRIRAMTPYPGARLTHNHTTYLVKSARSLASADVDEGGQMSYLDLETSEGRVRFFTGGVVANDR